MKSLNVEILMGHDIGISKPYYKPSEQELLQDYLKAVDLLTIHNSNSKLEKQVKELKEKSKDDDDLIKAKLREKDSQIQTYYLMWNLYLDRSMTHPKRYSLAGNSI